MPGVPVVLLETLWCIAVVLVAVLAFGLPVQWLIGGRRPLDESQWVRAPLTGLATIVLCAQPLVYMDVPVDRSAPWLWLGAMALWAWMVRRHALRAETTPQAVLVAALAVYGVHGCGLLLAGACHYVGRAWGDQFNYMVMADFLQHERFSLTFDDLGFRPYLLMAIVQKEQRIGQSVAHAFFASSALRDSRTLLEPAVLMSPALVFLSLHELRGRLTARPIGRWDSLATAAAATVPALAALHLEGFVSHCLAIPILLLWPSLVQEVATGPAPRTTGFGWLMFSALTAIYMEFVPIVLGLTACALGAAALRHPRPGRLLLTALLTPLPVVAFAYTPAWTGIVLASRYIGLSVLGFLYPWAHTLEGLARLWCGDLVDGSVLRRVPLQGTAIVFTVGGVVGLALAVRRAWARQRDAPGTEQAGTIALGVSSLLLVALPVAVWITPGDHAYQFYKLALTVTPVLALGVTLLEARPLRVALVALMAAVGIGGTAFMTARAGLAVPEGRSRASLLDGPAGRGLSEALASVRGRDLILVQQGGGDSILNAWLTYLGRFNHVWLTNPELNLNTALAEHPSMQRINDVMRAPADALLLSATGDPWSSIPVGARHVWSNAGYVLWQRAPGCAPTILSVRNPNGLETLRGKPFLWLGGGETRLYVAVEESGMLRLRARFLIWGGDPREVRRVRVRTASGHDEVVALRHGPGSIRVPVRAGIEEIRMMPEDSRVVSPGDPRLISVGVLAPELVVRAAGPGTDLDGF
jgi:hypothetical protein